MAIVVTAGSVFVPFDGLVGRTRLELEFSTIKYY